MLKELNSIDKKAFLFLFIFLNIILCGTVISVCYGVFYGYLSAEAPLLAFRNVKMSLEYLMTSLCECVGGAFLMDYIFRKK